MLEGIDVSVWQGQVVWADVKAAGKHFAAIKASEGNFVVDPQLARNWSHSASHSIRRIAYHFFHADIDGAQQAEYFHAAVHRAGGFKHGDCAALDIETVNGASAAQLVSNAEKFVQNILAKTQCGIYIYTGSYFWDGTLGSPRSAILARCPLWDASWGSRPSPISLWPHGASLWQYSASGRVPGIAGDCDLDRFLGTQEQYNLLADMGGRH